MLNQTQQALNDQKILLAAGICALVIYILPYCILGTNSYHLIGDNLDSSIPMYVVLGHSDTYWSVSNTTYLSEIMPGAIPRNSLPAPLKVTSLLFHFLPPYSAFIVNLFVTLVIGFLGMYFLCNRFIFKNRYPLISLFIALAFALIKCQTTFEGATFVVMPLALFATLSYFEAQSRHQPVYLFVLFITPFCASLVLSFIFIYGYLLLISLYFLSKKYSFAKWATYHIALLSGIIIANLGLIKLMIFPEGFTSQRSSRSNIYNNLSESIVYLKDFLWKEDSFHQHSQHHFILFCCVIILPVVFLYVKKMERPVGLVLIALLLNALFPAMLNSSFFGKLTGDISFFRSFDFNRFASLNPTWWFLLFAVILASLINIQERQHWAWITYVSYAIVLMNLGYILRSNYTYIHSVKAMVNTIQGRNYTVNSNGISTFSEYYATDLFQKAKQIIKDQPCAGMGIVPGVLQLNGIPTVDGYTNIYSNIYRTKWGQIIKGELQQMPGEAHKFYTWGNRCYLFSTELEDEWNYRGELFPKTVSEGITIHPDIDFALLKQTGCKYILSTVNIESNSSDINLVAVLNDSQYRYIIRIYQLI